MIDIEEIDNTIEMLENGSTSFDTCRKLASLYIVRENLNSPKKHLKTHEEKAVQKELSDILPQYSLYRITKRKYQLKELPKESVKESIKDVCKEIFEFLETLYINTDMEEEREELSSLINHLQSLI